VGPAAEGGVCIANSSIVQRNPLAYHESDEVRELLLELCALGYTDTDIADRLRQTGLVNRVTADEVRAYKVECVAEITSYIQKHSKHIIGKAVRAQKPFRIGEMDQLADMLIRAIPQWIDAKPNLAAQLGKLYLDTLKQLSAETGDLEGAQDTRNKFIETYQRANAEQKVKMMEALAVLDEVERQVGQPKLPDPHVVDVDWEQ